MSILKVLTVPNKELSKPSEPVTEIDQQFVDDMIETMYHYDGIGLAAAQVGRLEQIIVVDVDYFRDRDGPKNTRVLINPKIVETKGVAAINEACLSIPGYVAPIQRYANITVEYLDREGNGQTLEADGILSIALQHEIDHTKGILFIDGLSKLKRGMALKKVSKKTKKSEASCLTNGMRCL